MLSKDRETGLRAVLIYMVSCGFLSGLTMFYHPGKPLVNFTLILIVYIAGYLKESINARHIRNDFLCASLIFIQCISVFLDETAWFGFVVPFIIVPELLKSKSYRKYLLLGYSIFFIFFIILVGIVIPERVNSVLGVKWKYQFLNYAFFSNSSLFKIKFAWHMQNLFNLATCFFLMPVFWGKKVLLLDFTLLIFLVANLFSLKAKYRSLCSVFFRLSVLYAVFQTLILTRHLGRIYSQFYYGAPFGIFFAIFLSASLSSKTVRNSVAMVVLLIGSVATFQGVNGMWMYFHNRMYLPRERVAVMDMKSYSKITFGSLSQIRKIDENTQEFDALKRGLPPIAYGLLIEEKLRKKSLQNSGRLEVDKAISILRAY